MARKLFLSKHGLTACPSCAAHIRIDAETVTDTSCPFCGAVLVESARRGVLSGIRQVVASGRSGLVAASLLGLTTMAGCGSDDDTDPDTTSDTTTDTGSDTATDTTTDMGDAGVADTGGDMTLDIVDAVNDTPQPEYGIPADMFQDAVDDTPQPEYGLPADSMP